MILAAAGLVGLLYGFVVLVDPWDTLPLSPPAPRVPISTNARFSFPALARSQRFDSVILGSSVARLLQPAALNPGFSAHFANLAMNAATAYEQSRMLQVFLQAHPHPRVVIVALDLAWCDGTAARTTPRPFPEWMYERNLWQGYREMLTPYAVQEAANQFAVMVGWKRRRYGLDGYTSFVPDDSLYDPVKRDQAFARWPSPVDRTPAPAGFDPQYPAHPVLRSMLAAIPVGTRTILFFSPYHLEQQGAPGSATALRLSGCKRAVASIARQHDAEVLDFMIPSVITENRDNYWDPVHYRVAIAARITAGLIAGHSPDAQTLVEPK